MSIVAQCTNCGKKYKVADDAVGKQVRCQACQTTFTVAAAKAAVAAGSSTGQKRAPSAAMPSAGAAQQQALAKKLGLAPLPRNENAIFPEQPFRRSAGQADPLANHVVYDPGFSTVSVADYHATQMPKEQSMHDYMAEIEKEEGWAEKKEKSEMSPQTLYLLTGIAPLVVGLLAGIVAMVGFMDAADWVFSIGNVMTLYDFVRQISQASERSGMHGDEVSTYSTRL